MSVVSSPVVRSSGAGISSRRQCATVQSYFVEFTANCAVISCHSFHMKWILSCHLRMSSERWQVAMNSLGVSQGMLTGLFQMEC